ncbi:MAG: hypothetical protein ABFQ89_04735, partial [Chloroflexota bacterium]
LARGPLVAFGVLVGLIFADRLGGWLDVPADRISPFIVVAGIVIFQWLILLIKPQIERWFYFSERNEVIRIQRLRDRVLTPNDLRQLLENVSAALCELLQVESTFIASIGSDQSPRVELITGHIQPEEIMSQVDLLDLSNNDKETRLHNGLVEWSGFWLFPLFDREGDSVIGVLGLEEPSKSIQESYSAEGYDQRVDHLTAQIAEALEDRLLQQEVFAAMEGLLTRVSATRRAVGEPDDEIEVDAEILDQENLTKLVRDALRHYWGGPRLTRSPLLQLKIVRQSASKHQGSLTKAMRAVLSEAIESLRPEGDRSLTTAEWVLYNILELKFLKRYQVREVARRLAMSESDLYRKQRVAVEAVAQAIAQMEYKAANGINEQTTAEDGLDEQATA